MWCAIYSHRQLLAHLSGCHREVIDLCCLNVQRSREAQKQKAEELSLNTVVKVSISEVEGCTTPTRSANILELMVTELSVFTCVTRAQAARANLLLAVPSCLYAINNYLKFAMQVRQLQA